MNELLYIAPWLLFAVLLRPRKKRVDIDSLTIVSLMVLAERKSKVTT